MNGDEHQRFIERRHAIWGDRQPTPTLFVDRWEEWANRWLQTHCGEVHHVDYQEVRQCGLEKGHTGVHRDHLDRRLTWQVSAEEIYTHFAAAAEEDQ